MTSSKNRKTAKNDNNKNNNLSKGAQQIRNNDEMYVSKSLVISFILDVMFYMDILT